MEKGLGELKMEREIEDYKIIIMRRKMVMSDMMSELDSLEKELNEKIIQSEKLSQQQSDPRPRDTISGLANVPHHMR
jgi:hypothetical protein